VVSFLLDFPPISYIHSSSPSLFLSNLLFQHKLPEDFYGSPLKISISEYAPKVLREKTDVQATCDIYDDGTELHLARELLKRCKLTPLYKGPPDDGYVWGIYL
jgi:hypothetical protein